MRLDQNDLALIERALDAWVVALPEDKGSLPEGIKQLWLQTEPVLNQRVKRVLAAFHYEDLARRNRTGANSKLPHSRA